MIGTGFRFIFSILLLPGADATLVSLSIVDAFLGGGEAVLWYNMQLSSKKSADGENNTMQGFFPHFVSPAQALKSH